MQHQSKIRPLADAIRAIPPGATVAFGTCPALAALRELMRQDRADLTFLADGLAATLLAAAGFAVAAPPLDGLRAAALGVPFLPRPNPADPRGWTERPALRPDIALLHVRRADPCGRAQLAADALIAEAARAVIATAEQIVSAATIDRHAGEDAVGTDHVLCVAEAPYGAYPCAFPPLYAEDSAGAAQLRDIACDPPAFASWRAGLLEHWDMLDRFGARRLLAVTTWRGGR